MRQPNEVAAPLCFLDTETDGIHPDRKVWEFAAIRREPDGTGMETNFFLSIDLSTADPFGLRVGKFYERHPTGKKLAGSDFPYFDPEGAASAAVRIAQITHGAHIVGAVPNFDTEALAGLLRANGIAPAWHYHLVDVENLAIGYLAGKGTPVAPPWDSDAITAALGLDPVPDDERHTALGDARWAQRIYDAVMTAQEDA